MKQNIHLFFFIIVVLIILFPQNTTADDIKAREIMESLEKVSADIQNTECNMSGDIELISLDKEEEKMRRKIRYFSKCKQDEKLSIAFFLDPPNVKNIGYLSYEYDDPQKEDKAWLYMPSFKRVRRIVTSNESRGLVGVDMGAFSNFSFSVDPANYDCSFYEMKEIVIDNFKTWAIQLTPLTKEEIDTTGFKKHIIFVRQDNYDLLRLINFEKEDGYRTILSFNETQIIDGIKQITEISVKRKQHNKIVEQIILKLSNMKYNQNLEDKLFTLRTLKKGL